MPQAEPAENQVEPVENQVARTAAIGAPIPMALVVEGPLVPSQDKEAQVGRGGASATEPEPASIVVSLAIGGGRIREGPQAPDPEHAFEETPPTGLVAAGQEHPLLVGPNGGATCARLAFGS